MSDYGTIFDEKIAVDMPQVCEWERVLIDIDPWETSCGNAFEFNDGGPSDNGFIYCPYCGKPIKVTP